MEEQCTHLSHKRVIHYYIFRYTLFYVQGAFLAQLVERMAFNHVVVGSIPTDGVRKYVMHHKIIY